MTENQVMITGIALLGALGLGFYAVGEVRRDFYENKAEDFAEKNRIDTEYDISLQSYTKEKFYQKLGEFISWEERTRKNLNEIFGYEEEELYERDSYNFYKDNPFLLSYESKEYLQKHSMKQQWQMLREQLEDEVYSSIDELFGSAEKLYDMEKDTVRSCYMEDGFAVIDSMMGSLNDGNGMEAYLIIKDINKDVSGYYYDYDEFCEWEYLATDIAYNSFPQLLTEACDADLEKAFDSNDQDELTRTVFMVENISCRYDMELQNLSRTVKKKEELEYLNSPDVPRVGMSVTSAYHTKLGAPTKKTVDTGMWAHKKHEYGDIYWYDGDEMLFKAHYCDGVIETVTDTRGYTHSRPFLTPGAGYSSDEEIDPDDYDIQGYYQDYKDLYNSYDEAYDGFLDDDSVWDDYS